jgi:hypothetical protein
MLYRVIGSPSLGRQACLCLLVHVCVCERPPRLARIRSRVLKDGQCYGVPTLAIVTPPHKPSKALVARCSPMTVFPKVPLSLQQAMAFTHPTCTLASAVAGTAEAAVDRTELSHDSQMRMHPTLAPEVKPLLSLSALQPPPSVWALKSLPGQHEALFLFSVAALGFFDGA